MDISVIIPVRNGHNYLCEALASIRKQDIPAEIIVIDDGSKDDTVEIASEFGCRIISHPVSRGQVAAKNTGIAAAKGRFLMFMDHDDVMRPGILKVLSDALESDPSVAAVQGKVKDFVSPEIGSIQGIAVKDDAYYGLFTGAILMRRSVFDVVGKFSESLHTGEIIEWQTRMDQNGLKVKKIDLITTDRRIHNSNFGRTDGKVEYKDYAAVLRERLKMIRK